MIMEIIIYNIYIQKNMIIVKGSKTAEFTREEFLDNIKWQPFLEQK